MASVQLSSCFADALIGCELAVERMSRKKLRINGLRRCTTTSFFADASKICSFILKVKSSNTRQRQSR